MGSISRRQFGLGVSTAALAAAYGVPGRAQAPLVMKFSHVAADDTPKGKGAIKFRELAEKYTGGKVKVETYPNSQLFKDKEEIEALQLGAVQFLAPSTAKFAPLGAKEFEALDLPFAFKDEAQFQNLIKGELGQYLLSKLEPRGVKGLAFWDNGFHMVSANVPLLKPSDFQGLKFRISGSKIADLYFRKFGAIPQILAFSEVYQAMQTGVVDGCENTPSNYFTQKFHEVQKHITNSKHGHLQYTVIVNAKIWAALPADIRTPLEKAMDEASVYANSIALQENVDALRDITASGKSTIHTLTDAQRGEWLKTLLPVWQQAESRVGKEAIDIMRKVTGQTA